MKNIEVVKNRYVDSVTLMGLSESVKKLSGVISAEAQMATPANREVMADVGFDIPEDAAPNDLVLAVHAKTAEQLENAMQRMHDLLDRKVVDSDEVRYSTLDEIDLSEDPYDLVQISLPGEYAAAEAKKAITLGLDVFMFSDNVPIEDEAALKKLGREKGRLVMGPDCGVGLINGVALAAGSIVRPGPIGIVGASGSGAQEVACLIEKIGSGVSAVIGTGGRDLSLQVGGISMQMGMERMEQDEKTRVIVLVSKLADQTIMQHMLDAADALSKPVVAVFLGADKSLFDGHTTQGAFSLEEAAVKAVAICSGNVADFGLSDEKISQIVLENMPNFRPEQKYFRGLFCGGTFAEESMIYLHTHHPDVVLYSNLETRYAEKLESSLQSRGHTILDLGAEDFTATAPHPIFDPVLRVRRLEKELEDPEVAVVLLDFIAGPGVHLDPVSSFIPVCKAAIEKKHVMFIAAITGSEEDPQNVAEEEELLRAAGVVVTKSNYQSTRLAGAMMAALNGR